MAIRGLFQALTWSVFVAWHSACPCRCETNDKAYNFTPAVLNQLVEGHSRNVTVLITNCSYGETFNVSVTVSDTVVASCSSILEYRCNGSDGGAVLSVTGLNVGFASLSFRGAASSKAAVYSVGVIRQPSVWDDVFNYLIMVIVAINSFGFGVALNLDVVKNDLKRPLAVLLGLGGQFIAMPLLGFGLTKVFDLNTESGLALAIGVFATGIASGGGSSNIWCLLLDADVDLSIVVTFIGAILCLGLIPMWFYTLGTHVFPELANSSSQLQKLLVAIVQTVALATVPILLGLPVRRFAPKAAKVIMKILPPFSFVIILVVLGTGTYANLYSFVLIAREPMMALCATVLPYGGLALGALLALAARLPARRVKTLAIELMAKNTIVSVLILRYSLPQPAADYSSAVPLSLGHLAVLPTIVALVVRAICYCKRRRMEFVESEGGGLSSETHGEGGAKRASAAGKDWSTDPALVELADRRGGASFELRHTTK